MNADVVNVIIESVLNVLSTTAGIEARLEAPFMEPDWKDAGRVGGTLTLTGDPEWDVAVRFSDSCILGTCSRMFGEPVTAIDRDVQDAVGEIVNMICGQATNTLAQQGIGRETRPGKAMDQKDILQGEEGTVVFPFATEVGGFCLEVQARG